MGGSPLKCNANLFHNDIDSCLFYLDEYLSCRSPGMFKC